MLQPEATEKLKGFHSSFPFLFVLDLWQICIRHSRSPTIIQMLLADKPNQFLGYWYLARCIMKICIPNKKQNVVMLWIHKFMFKMSHVHSGVFLPALAWHKFEVMTKWRNKLTQLTAVICIYDIELVGVIERLRQQRGEKREATTRVMLLPPLMRSLCLCF